jgi:hypothetical protein
LTIGHLLLLGSSIKQWLTVTFNEVLRETKGIRSDTSTGPDQLSAKYLKIVAQLTAGPLTHIINSFVAVSSFPVAWKVARITPIPKSNNSNSNSNMRRISKVFERLTHYQLVEHIDSQKLLKENISGFRKGHSTTTVLIDIRDDVLRAMKRGEVTLMVLQ